jgi:hypothetical protein
MRRKEAQVPPHPSRSKVARQTKTPKLPSPRFLPAFQTLGNGLRESSSRSPVAAKATGRHSVFSPATSSTRKGDQSPPKSSQARHDHPPSLFEPAPRFAIGCGVAARQARDSASGFEPGGGGRSRSLGPPCGWLATFRPSLRRRERAGSGPGARGGLSPPHDESQGVRPSCCQWTPLTSCQQSLSGFL